MPQQPACRRHQHNLAARVLLLHLDSYSLGHQPALGDIGVHDVEKTLGRHVLNFCDVVLAGGNDQNVDATKFFYGVCNNVVTDLF